MRVTSSSFFFYNKYNFVIVLLGFKSLPLHYVECAIKYIKRFALHLVDSKTVISFAYKTIFCTNHKKRLKTLHRWLKHLCIAYTYTLERKKPKSSVCTFTTVFATIADNYYQREFWNRHHYILFLIFIVTKPQLARAWKKNNQHDCNTIRS